MIPEKEEYFKRSKEMQKLVRYITMKPTLHGLETFVSIQSYHTPLGFFEYLKIIHTKSKDNNIILKFEPN